MGGAGSPATDLGERLRALEHAERVQHALYAISELSTSSLPLPEMLQQLHQIIGGLMYAENLFIAQRSPCGRSLHYLYYADSVDRDLPQPDEAVPLASLEHGISWHAIHDARPIMAHAADPAHRPSGQVRRHGAPSLDWVAVPMQRDGVVRGVLVVQSYDIEHRFDERDMHLLAFVADHILTALERRRARDALEAEVAQRTEELARVNAQLRQQMVERERGEQLQAILYRIAALSSSQMDEQAFFHGVHSAVATLVNADNFYIALLDAERQWIRFAYIADDTEKNWQARPLGNGLTERVLRTGRTLLLDSAGLQGLIDAGELDAANVGVPAASWLGAPLFGPDGPLGVVAVQTYQPELAYSPADADLFTFLARQVSSTIERRIAADMLRQANTRLEQRVTERTAELEREVATRRRMEAQLQHEVVHDALTGLPNRVYLRDRLDHLLAMLRREPERGFALLYLDLDRFKLVNDSLGHLAGDEVLRAFARRVNGCLREEDLLARISGDEFAILMEHATRPQDATRVARRILQSLQTPLEVAGRALTQTSSIGIAMVGPEYTTTDHVLHDADMALYRAKHAGRNRIVLFDDAMQRDALDVPELEQGLRRALAQRQFVPWFQPIFDLRSGQVAAYEALLRWEHPQQGVLAPGQFLGVAEDAGLLEEIDWRMFRESLRQAQLLPQRDCTLSLNVSPRLFRRGNFGADLLALLKSTGFPPQRLKIEITERVLLRDPEAVGAILAQLAQAGVRTCLDDFGAGYSSLSHVRQFPLSEIKIDRSFIAPLTEPGGERTRAILETILALGRALDVEIVAEGVETQAQLELLRSMDCPYVQGYLLGRPQPAQAWAAAAG